MDLEKTSGNIEKKPNALENEINGLDPEYIITKGAKYVRKVELIKEGDKKIRKASKTKEEKDFFDWQSSIELISSRMSAQNLEENSEKNLFGGFGLSLWKYKKALEFMMIIDVMVRVNKKITGVRSEIASSLEDGDYNENEEYQIFLKEAFLNEVDKFQRKYKKAFNTEVAFDEALEEIANCVATYYSNKNAAKLFKEAVSMKSGK